MLNRLTIKNVALIDSAEIEFGEGLNVLSGETGAGKSVLLDSINFALGAKADKSMIRHGESECFVSACFLLAGDSPVFSELAEMGIEGEEEMIVSRRFRADGRGDIKINGSPVNATMLKKITAHLVDVHGQSEHFYLLNELNQLKVVDKFAGDAFEGLKGKISEILSSLRENKKRLFALGGDEKERGRRIDILKFQIDEIENAQLKEGEEEELLAKRLLIHNMERIGRALSEAREALGGENGAMDCLRAAGRCLAEVSRFGEEYASLSERLESVCLEAEDISETVAAAAEDLSFDENEADRVEKRLDVIRSVQKKYGNSFAEVMKFEEEIAEELDVLQHCDEESEKLEKSTRELCKQLYALCNELTILRKAAAKDFCARVSEELKTLNIKNANFCAEFDSYGEEDAPRATQNGLDSMRFLFSANAGEPLKPLSKVISGGEMSRLMLAIKTKMSDINEIDTYIFDEIDAGISGNTARVVAEKFADIAKKKQIIAVSHLAQISAMADENFVISKTETEQGKTVTRVSRLRESEKIAEIVRLVGGEKDSAAAQNLAGELIKTSLRYKK